MRFSPITIAVSGRMVSFVEDGRFTEMSLEEYKASGLMAAHRQRMAHIKKFRGRMSTTPGSRPSRRQLASIRPKAVDYAAGEDLETPPTPRRSARLMEKERLETLLQRSSRTRRAPERLMY